MREQVGASAAAHLRPRNTAYFDGTAFGRGLRLEASDG